MAQEHYCDGKSCLKEPAECVCDTHVQERNRLHKEEVDQAYKDGHEEGYDEGYDDGVKADRDV